MRWTTDPIDCTCVATVLMAVFTLAIELQAADESVTLTLVSESAVAS
jgi:hypothetical protein